MIRISRNAGPRTVAAVALLLLCATHPARPQQAPPQQPPPQQGPPSPTTYRPAANVCAVHDFGMLPADGQSPSQVGLFALAPDNSSYLSTTPAGSYAGHTSAGTIFQLTPDADGINVHYDVLYSFDTTPHGGGPLGGLVKGNDCGSRQRRAVILTL